MDDAKSENGELDYESSCAGEEEEGQKSPKVSKNSDNGADSPRDDLEDGEIDELEEGEVKDEDFDYSMKSTVKIPSFSNYAPKSSNFNASGGGADENGVCKYFLRGQCTWSNFCKFLHPGVDNSVNLAYHTPKADILPPLMSTPAFVAAPAPPPMIFTAPPPNYQLQPPPTILNVASATETQVVASKPQQPPQMRFLPPPPVPPAVLTSATAGAGGESAWERGLKQARQMMKSKEGGVLENQPIEKEKPIVVDSRRYYSREGEEEKNPKNVYKRTSYEAKEWRDPWMRSTTTTAAEQSPTRKRRRSYSDSSRSSLSDLTSDDEQNVKKTAAKRRGRRSSASSSSPATKSRSRSRSRGDDVSSSASSTKGRRQTGSRRIKKKMDAGRLTDDEGAQSPVELDEFDRTTTSIGFDIRNLVTKKELTNSPRKPIKLTINTKSRVQVPAAYGASKLHHRSKRPLQQRPSVDHLEQDDRLSSVSPCDLPSDEDEKVEQAALGAGGGRHVELEDISPQGSSDEEEEEEENDGGRRSRMSNQSEERRRSYNSENDKEDISSEDSDESSSSSSDNEEPKVAEDHRKSTTPLDEPEQQPAAPILAPSATSLSNVASTTAAAAEDSPSPQPTADKVLSEAIEEEKKEQLETKEEKMVVPPLKLTVNSRREELLKQLRAVEEAIAKKRSMKTTT